jgi:hypothetical protein
MTSKHRGNSNPTSAATPFGLLSSAKMKADAAQASTPAPSV